jgi:hypothetical protein
MVKPLQENFRMKVFFDGSIIKQSELLPWAK